MATERVTIVVTSKGTVTVKKEIEDIGGAARKSASGVDMLKGALAGLTAYFSISAITKYGDAFLNIQNRLRLVDSATESLTRKTQELYDVAQNTRTGYESVVSLYQRSADTIKQLGMSADQGVTFVDLLSKAATASGTSAQLASQGIEQFSQALSNGRLNGDELVSVMTNIPYVAKILADSLKVPVGQLKAMGEQGLLTSDILVKALMGSAEQINQSFATQLPTISQGLIVIDNALIRLAGLLESNTGAFGMLGAALVFVGNNLEYFALALSPLLLGLSALAARAVIVAGISGLGAMVQAIGLLVPALNLARTALVALNLAFLANPVTLIVGGIALAVTGLLLFGQRVLELMGLWDGFVQAAVDAFNTVYDYAASFLNWVSGKGWTISVVDDGAAEAITEAGKNVSNEFTSSITDGGTIASTEINSGILSGGTELRGTMDATFTEGGTKLKEGIESGGMSFTDAVYKTFQDIIGWFRDLFSKATNDIKQAASQTAVAKAGGGDGPKKAAETIERSTKSAVDNIAKAQETAGDKAAKSIEKAGEKAGGSISGGGSAAAAAIEDVVKNYASVGTASVGNYGRSSSGSGTRQHTNLGVTGMQGGEAKVGNRYQGSGYRSGGQFMVGGNGGEDSQMVNFRASPNERVTVETPAQQRANDANKAGMAASPQITSVVVLDAKAMLEMMNTQAGHDIFVQMVTVRREEVQQILGVA